MEKNQLFIATCRFGLESALNWELRALNALNVRSENARVFFEGDFSLLCAANIHLRSAERIFWQLASFEARSFEQLFQGISAIAWEDILPRDACFPVKGKTAKSQLHSVSDCQAIAKKAIVERMKKHYGVSWFSETGSKIIVEVGLLDDIATIALDSSGAGLARRGYRLHHGEAPLAETLAAGLLMLCHWRGDKPFLDPCCGAGTIALEAAMIAHEQAPGLGRGFAAEDWPWISPKDWINARQQAREREKLNPNFEIVGSDIDAGAILAARHNAAQRNLNVRFIEADLSALPNDSGNGLLVCNPPYGERLLEREAARALYCQMGEAFRRRGGWQIGVFTADTAFERFFGKRADKRRKLYNSALPCQFYQYFPQKTKSL